VEQESFVAHALRDFLMLFVTIDPIGTLSLFVPLTATTPPAQRPRVALRSVLYGGGILITFLVAGQIVLNGLGVRLESFQIAGGVILFLLGLQMVFGTGIAASGAAPEAGYDVAVFPLAIPSIASPGAITAVVVLTDNDRFSLLHQVETGVVLLAVLGITYGVLRLANPIHGVIGDTGATVMVRVMGLLLAALAAEELLESLTTVARNFPSG
jgi:multiple antibiotic resistance protein